MPASAPTPDLPTDAAPPARAMAAEKDAPMRRSGAVGVVSQLVKARLTALVLVTTAAGFALAAPFEIDWVRLAWTILGTGLAAAAASMLNQLAEVARDARMRRTRGRPLPTGRVGRMPVFAGGVVLAYLGVGVLAMETNLLAAGLALANLLVYVLVYTPLKPWTTLNTIVGAVTGAVPPLIGWAAAAGELHGAAWILAGILFVWQLPHFLALAWMYRDDYQLGGFRMLPSIDHEGRITSLVSLSGSLLLVPLGLLGVRLGVAGWWYGAASVLLALWMSWRALQLWRDHSIERARRVFMASLVYLPLLLGIMVLDRGPVSAQAWLDGGREVVMQPVDPQGEGDLP
jgi:protoheme IX farnesyltransferase